MEFEELKRVRTLARERGSLAQGALLSTKLLYAKAVFKQYNIRENIDVINIGQGR